MKEKRVISVFLINLLIIGSIGFAYAAVDPNDPTNTTTDPGITEDEIEQTIISVNGDMNTATGVVDGLGESIENKNKYLDYIKNKINEEGYEYKDAAKHLLQKIIAKQSNNPDLTVNINDDSNIEKIELSGTTPEDSNLKVKVGGKEIDVPIGKLPEEVKGIEVTKNSVKYNFDEAGKEYIEMVEPGYTLSTNDDGEVVIEGYVGADGEAHEVIVKFEGEGRVTIKEDGILEFAGEAKIFDPNTNTLFELKDKTNAAGHLSFYEEGHIVKVNAGSRILVTKEDEGLVIEMAKNGEDGMFILSKEGINKEFSDYPSGFDKSNSFLIDSEGKVVYVPESKENKGFITGEGYQLVGIPNTPSGGILLNGTNGYGGGNIFGNVTPGGPGGTPGGGKPPGPGPGPGGDPGGGILGGILPYLLIGGGLLLALLLLGGKKDKGGEGGGSERSSNSSDRDGRVPDDLGYNDGDEPTTGRPATPSTMEGSAPRVISPYAKDSGKGEREDEES